MKKIGLLLLLIFVTFSNLGATTHHTKDPFIDLVTLTMDNQLPIKKWQVTMREEVSHEKAIKIKQHLRQKHHFTMEDNKNSVKYMFRDNQENDKVEKYYLIIIPTNSMYHAEVIATMTGNGWDHQTEKNYHRAVTQLPDYLFSEKVRKYSCLTTVHDVRMYNDCFFDELARKLNINHIRRQTDTVTNRMNEQIVYGYTALWNENFVMNKQPTNFQMARKPVGDSKVKLTIGTPILITEY